MTNSNKLGFGLMRLPRLSDGSIDIEQVKVMVDKFMNAGFTYFDTAYVYEGSEEAARKALVERHPRESYTLATKLNAGYHAVTCEKDAKDQFYTSLERTGAGYFDYYLLHALQPSNIDKYNEFHIWDFAKELKEKGLVKNYGFSFHSTPEMLDELLTEHPDVDFIQLQINYADWNNPAVRSRECLEVARKHNKPVVVMEPIKGGTLANPPKQVAKVLDEANPDASYASWAVRFVASQDGVFKVLSGMSNIEQMDNNLSYMKDFKPLDEKETKVIEKVQSILESIDSIPCTKCSYCTPGCPMQIPIPTIFEARNRQVLFDAIEDGNKRYAKAAAGGSKASDCIQCGQCEAACPQHINIIERLAQCAAVFDK